MIVKTLRNFLPEKIKITSWEVVEPYFKQLLETSINNRAELEKWLLNKSELEAFLSEDLAWRYVRMTCDTENKDFEKSYLFYVSEIEPKISPLSDQLNRKLVASPYLSELDNEKYAIYLRGIKKEIEIFRESNVPLFAEIAIESQKYGSIVGSMMVEIDGKELTLQQAANFLKDPDRNKREHAFNLINTKRLLHAEELDELFNKLIGLRHKVAINAGFENFRDYMFAALGRFDYSSDDCFAFHQAIQTEVLPIATQFNQKREKELGHKLRPWDLEVDTKNRTALEPFTSGKDLLDKTVKCFRKVDDYFAWCIETMDNMERLDLESRKGKAPGGYNCPLAESGAPFIFMNAAGQMSDVTTMVHEGGHAIHSFLSHHLSLSAFKEYPMEIAEVASMSMELFSMDHWQSFFDNETDLNRAKEHQLERTITIFPWIAIIDKFQHWVYEHPAHTIEERTQTWTSILKEFSTGSIDYTGLDEFRAIGWQRQLHLFEVPFYYIEYGIAQLGAIGMWMQYQQNPSAALENYMNALALGGTKTLPELYQTAGIEFNFSPNYVKNLMDFTNAQLEKLYQ